MSASLGFQDNSNSDAVMSGHAQCCDIQKIKAQFRARLAPRALIAGCGEASNSSNVIGELPPELCFSPPYEESDLVIFTYNKDKLIS
jgi:hypothetical protein